MTNIWSTNQAVAAWTQVILDLRAFKGGAHTLRFEFDSDPSVNFEGWYLDEISMRAYPALPNDNRANAFVIAGISGSTLGWQRLPVARNTLRAHATALLDRDTRDIAHRAADGEHQSLFPSYLSVKCWSEPDAAGERYAPKVRVFP